jgi:ABC-type hemin transport system ATPase subunit
MKISGNLTMVVGEVGSGKTALLNAVLGEMSGSKRTT